VEVSKCNPVNQNKNKPLTKKESEKKLSETTKAIIIIITTIYSLKEK